MWDKEMEDLNAFLDLAEGEIDEARETNEDFDEDTMRDSLAEVICGMFINND